VPHMTMTGEEGKGEKVEGGFYKYRILRILGNVDIWK
jgi:hypothetical protein